MTQATMAKTFLGLATASELAKAQADRDYWRKLLCDTNDVIERFQQENKKLKADLDTLQKRHDALKQDLAECRTWAKHLEDTNKEQVELIAKQQEAITKALDEAKTIAELRNEADIKITSLKLENQRYRETVKMAIDNLALEIN